MKFKLQHLTLHYEKYPAENQSLSDVLLLHGFTGSGEDWEFLIPSLKKTCNLYTIDLVGHGRSDSPSDAGHYTMDSLTGYLNEFIGKVIKNNPVMLGYSMGGRIALSYAAAFPENIKALILESSAWGIKEKDQRETRIKEDEKIAGFILSSSMEEFTEFWMNRPIFKTQKNLNPEILKRVKSGKMKNNPVGLSNSLLAAGTGKMNPPQNNIKGFRMPVLLITGGLDKKFTGINSEMAALLENAKHVTVPEAGHNVHLEKPGIFTNVIKDFLKNLKFL